MTRRFIPAATFDWALPFYDPIQRFVVHEATVKRKLLDQADVKTGHRILDVGCGTGFLTVLARSVYPDSDVVGLDPDPKALALARRKAETEGVAVRFDRGFSDELPYPDASFDRVLSSFMFHHLTTAEKLATLREVRRVLAPGGQLHLLDFGQSRGWYTRLLGHTTLRGERLRDNIEGRIPALMEQTGFVGARETDHHTRFFGVMSYYGAENPTTPDPR